MRDDCRSGVRVACDKLLTAAERYGKLHYEQSLKMIDRVVIDIDDKDLKVYSIAQSFVRCGRRSLFRIFIFSSWVRR